MYQNRVKKEFDECIENLPEADQPEKAEQAYREALNIHPNNGRSLKGLKQSLNTQGKTAEAKKAEEAFEEAWKRADLWLRNSRF